MTVFLKITLIATWRISLGQGRFGRRTLGDQRGTMSI